MYRVYCDGELLFDPRDAELQIMAGKVSLATNATGEFTFALPALHDKIRRINKLQSVIEVNDDEEKLFCGRVLSSKTNIYGSVEYSCEGELSHLLDSIQRPKSYHDLTPRIYLKDKLEQHNSQVEESKHFILGIVEKESMNYDAREDNQYTNTLDTIMDKLIKSNGGYLRVRKENGVRYLDYLEDYGRISGQVIRFGENVLDLTEHIKAEDVITVLIPLGGTPEGSDSSTKLTIASVNEGKDYLEDSEAIALYGRIVGTNEWPDVTVPANLKAKGLEHLKNSRNLAMTIELTALDLHLVDVDIDRIRVGDMVRVVSAPHGLDRYMMVSKREYNLLNPSEDKIYLGDTISTLTERQLALQKEIDKQKDATASDRNNVLTMTFNMNAQMAQLGMDSLDAKQRIQSLETEIVELNEKAYQISESIQDILKRLETLETPKEERGETS